MAVSGSQTVSALPLCKVETVIDRHRPPPLARPLCARETVGAHAGAKAPWDKLMASRSPSPITTSMTSAPSLDLEEQADMPERASGNVVVSGAVEDDVAEEIEDRAAMQSPFYSTYQDLKVLLANLHFLPNIFLPLKAPRALPGVPQKPSIVKDYLLVAVVTVLQVPLIAGFPPALILLPGWAVVLIYGIGVGTIYLISTLLWGPVLVPSQTAGVDPHAFPREQWLFVNGIATGHVSVQKSVDNIAATFGRPVMGVYNKTAGIFGDLIECIIQRSFLYRGTDVRVCCEALREVLLSEDIDKVVLIAHSQGGIIVSLSLDYLYAVLPAKAMEKLEIYTFGSAASTFHDPLTHLRSKSGSQILGHAAQTESPIALSRQTTLSRDSQTHAAAAQSSALEAPTYLKGRLIPYIEHYCNGRDLVPRWGVLYHIQFSSPTTYAGRVFKHENASGHLFDQHYLEPMFPLWEIDNTDDPSLFLNHVVKHHDGERGILRARTLGLDSDGLDEVMRADSGRPRTVRELSRLWRYVGGRQPGERKP